MPKSKIAQVHKTAKMSILFEAYAKRRGVERRKFHFLFNGCQIYNDDSTPEENELEDMDCIDVFSEQVGC
jgi:Ubiquitin-2 like Rad60 SUMO-like